MNDPNQQDKIEEGVNDVTADVADVATDVVGEGIAETAIDSIGGFAGDIVGGIFDSI